MTIWYINADTGDDGTGDGSSGNPWETITKAHTEASDDDTIICQDSTAAFDFANLVMAKDLTIQGEQEDASGAKFESGGIGRKWQFAGSRITVIENLTFQDILGSSNAIFAVYGSGNDVSFKNCIFRDIKVLYAAANGRGLIGSNALGDHCNVTIENCLIDDIYPQSAAHGVVLLSSRFWDVNSSYTIIGSTFYFKNTAHIRSGFVNFISSPNMSVNIKNCIISNETGGTVHFDIITGSPDEDYEITYTDLFNITGSPATGTGAITSDPLLVDPVNDNFNLRPASPCIDTGTLL